MVSSDMAPRWETSSLKHGIPRGDQIYAMLHATLVQSLPDEEDGRDGRIRLFIGSAHAQTERELEILVREFDDGREAIVFHAMELGSKYRIYREEHRND